MGTLEGCYILKEKQNYQAFLTSMNITEEADIEYSSKQLEEIQLIFHDNNGTWTQISPVDIQNFNDEYIVNGIFSCDSDLTTTNVCPLVS